MFLSFLQNLLAQCGSIVSVLMLLSFLLELKKIKITLRLALIIEIVGCGVVYYNILMILLLILVLIVLPIIHIAAKLEVYTYIPVVVINLSLYFVALILLLTLNYCVNFVNMKRARKSKESLLSKLTKVVEHIPERSCLEENAEEAVLTLVPLLKEISCALQKDICPILTGSAAESFSIPLSGDDGQYWGISRFNKNDRHALLSDHDFLLENISDKASFNKGEEYFIDDNSLLLHPGFVLMYDSSGSLVSSKEIKRRMFEAVTNIDFRKIDGIDSNERSAILGSFPKVYILGGYSHIIEKGPAICLNYHIAERQFCYSDLTFGIRCVKEWPSLSDWPKRTSRRWPDEIEVDRIVKMGFHLVPKSQPDDEEGLTWRYSFSLAEIELSKLIHPNAKRCFIAMKIIGKDFLKQSCKRFKSYHMKVI